MKEIQRALEEFQTNMVLAALEYCEEKVEYVYIYAYYEGSISGQMFFRVNDKVVETHKLVEEIENFKKVDPSKELYVFIDELKKFAKFCDENNHDMPTEFKMKYRVSDGKFQNKMKYDDQFVKASMGINDIYDKWLEGTINGDDGFDWD